MGSLYDVAGLPDGLANQHRSTGLPGSVKRTTMGLFKSPWRSKVAAVAAFQSPEPPAEEFVKPPPPPPPPGRDAATIVEELAAMTDAVEAARVALARTGTIIPKMGFGDDLEAAEVQLDACEAKLDEIVRLGRTSAAATRRLGDAEKAGRRALAAAGAAADARVAAADAVWGAIAAVAYVRAAAAEDLLRATTAAHRRSTAAEQAVGAATAAFAAATTAAAAARLGARHVFAADAALEFEPAVVPDSPEAPATPATVVPESPEAPATPREAPSDEEAPATPVEAEAETPAVEGPAPAEEGDLVECGLGVGTVKAVVRDGAAYVVEKRDNTGVLVVPSATCEKVAAPLTIKSPVAATKAAVHWRRSVKRYVDPETQYEYLYDEKTGESKWAAGEDWAVDPRLHNIARQIMARQKIIRAFRAKRSPVKAIRAVAAVARWQRYTDPETKQDYLYDEASGQSKWADGSAEVWTANPRLANVAREIIKRRRRSKDAAFAAAAGAVADERLGREAAERRLRLTEKENVKLDFKLRVALEATGGVDLRRIDRDFAGCAADCARMRLELMQERSTRAQSAARRRHANYGRRKTADGKIKREVKPLTPPHMHAADVTAQFLRDLGHPTTVIINRRGADQKPLWLKDAPW